MASGNIVKEVLEEAPVKTPHGKYKNKRVRQLLDSYLEYGSRIAPEGMLGYTLYTVLPNPGRDLKSSWQQVEQEWISVKKALESCGEVGVLAAFLNVETHPPDTKKGKAPEKPVEKRPRRAPAPHEVLLDGAEEVGSDQEPDVPALPIGSGAPANEPESGKLHKQALKPHFHAVLMHDLSHANLRDPGFLNRLLATRDLQIHEAGGTALRFQVRLWSGGTFAKCPCWKTRGRTE